MHDSAGYQFNGISPIAGLTPLEVDTLMLGHLVHQEAAEDSSSGDPGDNADVRKRKQELRRGHRKAREEAFGDLGIQ